MKVSYLTDDCQFSPGSALLRAVRNRVARGGKPIKPASDAGLISSGQTVKNKSKFHACNTP